MHFPTAHCPLPIFKECYMAIKWIFFDIGDVLFDEDPQHIYYLHSLLLALRRNGVDVSWDEYYARVQAFVRARPTTAIVDAAHYYVPDETLWQKVYHEGRGEYEQMRKPRPYGMLLNDIMMVIQDLHRDFRLGIVANQHAPIMDAIRDYGMLPYFDVIAIDEIIGVSKPDPGIFRWALDKAGCTAEEAIGVGDRPDHDTAPCRSLGMLTVRFRRGMIYSLYDAQGEEEDADAVVYDTVRLAPAIRQLARAVEIEGVESILRREWRDLKVAGDEDRCNRPSISERGRQQRNQAEAQQHQAATASSVTASTVPADGGG
jgi:5'-nucleotidase